MKYLSFVALLSAAYFIYAPTDKKDPASGATQVASNTTPAAKPTPSTDFLKRPLDRTHEVLDQVRAKTAKEGGF